MFLVVVVVVVVVVVLVVAVSSLLFFLGVLLLVLCGGWQSFPTNVKSRRRALRCFAVTVMSGQGSGAAGGGGGGAPPTLKDWARAGYLKMKKKKLLGKWYKRFCTVDNGRFMYV